ncbi:MAG: glycosyltransferase [Planctomycetes bacterium]|nr:glycosyltransferase [Planctomycetota bacterium]
METPQYSLVVPAHDEEKTLLPTLQALAAQQTPIPYEIVIACNGCHDGTAAIAQQFAATQPAGRVVVAETEQAGMSFGKNFGARNSNGAVLVFVDADTLLPANALEAIAAAIDGQGEVIGTMAGRPDRGGLVVRACFLIANFVTKRNRVHAPGGVMVMQRAVWEKVGGFAEDLPQGTSSDLIMRALAAGANYAFIDKVKATTSIRRFEKTGIIRQMLAWKKNHRELENGRRDAVAGRTYEDVR